MKLLILGAGEYGQLVKELARNKYATIDFLDDNSAAAIGKISDLEKYKGEYHAIVAIGNPEKRKELFDKLVVLGINIPTIVSDKAYISPSAEIEQGCVIEPMAIINTGAKIKRGTFVNAGAVVNHNSVVNEFCQIDCNAVVGADAEVPAGTHLNYCQTMRKVGKPENWSFSE
jgi:tetrahydrodipicolinate N-succinyltransferase